MSRKFTIEKAVRRGNKARVALAAPAGGGKTFTALTLAVELAKGDDILVIDTERGSASLYADQFDFQTLAWEPPYSPPELAQVITDVSANFGVVVVDSLSHFWMGEGGTLDMVDAASERARGNKFAGWKTGTPAQNDMVDAMLRSPSHLIVTMRSRMEYVQDKDERGRTTIRRVGMAPVQRDGIEYEFTVTADLDIEHKMMIAKTRCSLLADKVYRPGHAADMGRTLADWLADASPQAPALPAAQAEGGEGHRPTAALPTGTAQEEHPPAPAAPPSNGHADVPANQRPFTDEDATLASHVWRKQFTRRLSSLSAEDRAEVVTTATSGRTVDPMQINRGEEGAAEAAAATALRVPADQTGA